MISRLQKIMAVVAALGLGACDDDNSGFSTVEEPPDAGCIREQPPRSYSVYFVLDVSGSMSPFLTDVKEELVTFANGFAEEDAEGRRVLVDYYVIAFVNDYKWFPENARRMTSPIAVQAAFEEAIQAGSTNNNLTQPGIINAEPEENMLDAIAQVIADRPSSEATMVLIATDAPFAEAPQELSTNIHVQSNYASIRADLAAMNARVHAFTREQLDGLTRMYNNMPALTELPGSSVHSLEQLTGANQVVRDTLSTIAREAACN